MLWRMDTKPMHIFRAGQHIDAHGAHVEITADDIQASAAAYDVNLHEAPITIGHPKMDEPAYGWVEKLAADAGDLHAMPRQVDPAFSEMVESGAFKKVSASFYRPDAPNNPKPGVWYLRHVGFLGAMPPAVKGLRQVAFADGDDGVVTVEFGEFEDRTEAGLWRSLREWILAKFGKEDADSAVPGFDVDLLQREAARPKKTKLEDAGAAFSESQEEGMSNKKPGASPEDASAAFAEREAELNAREQALIERERQAHRAECIEFVEGLVAAGKVPPAQKSGLIDFMTELGHTDVVAFGEGDDKLEATQLQFMQNFLQGLPEVVAFGEHSSGEDEAGIDVTVHVPAGFEVNKEKAELHARAVAFAEEHKVDYITAVKAVSK